MDLDRTLELERAIRESVASKVGYLVYYEDHGPTIGYGRILNIGLDYCVLRLHPVANSKRHRISVLTEHNKPKTFRETKGGWFAIDNIANHVVRVVEDEAERRGEKSRARRRLDTVRNGIARLKEIEKEMGMPGVGMAPSAAKPGLLDITIRELTEAQALAVISSVYCVTSKVESTVWDHLLEDDS